MLDQWYDEMESRFGLVFTILDRAYVIDPMNDPDVRHAFQIANRAMAAAARRRQGLAEGRPPDQVDAPAWRPFQLAYILMNLRGIVEERTDDGDPIQIVVSGPDPAGTARDTGVVLRELFQKASACSPSASRCTRGALCSERSQIAWTRSNTSR